MVTLNESYDYGGGGGFYFVNSSDCNQQYVVKLSLGDAIIFQSDLLHGINI
jgi:predicted 2-oxoglutarate/Fe(II)-dependent dioxygenase YbiX